MANKINWYNVLKNNFINNKKATLDRNTWQNNTYVNNNWTPALFTEQSILTSETCLLLDIWFRILKKKALKTAILTILYIKIGKLNFEKFDFKSCFSPLKTNKFYKNLLWHWSITALENKIDENDFFLHTEWTINSDNVLSFNHRF